MVPLTSITSITHYFVFWVSRDVQWALVSASVVWCVLVSLVWSGVLGVVWCPFQYSPKINLKITTQKRRIESTLSLFTPESGHIMPPTVSHSIREGFTVVLIWILPCSRLFIKEKSADYLDSYPYSRYSSITMTFDDTTFTFDSGFMN